MPASAVALALAAAFVHAGWNVLTARAAESQVAAGVALLAGSIAFAPLAFTGGDLSSEALRMSRRRSHSSWATSLPRHRVSTRPAERGLPVARGAAPVLVLVGSVAFLAARPGACRWRAC